MARLLRPPRDERGLTLSELLVSVGLLSIVLLGIVLGSTFVYRGHTMTSQDSDTLDQLRVALDRVEREVRQARRVYVGSTSSYLQIWADFDRDNQQDLTERIVYQVTEQPSGSGRGQLTRTTMAAGAPVKILARDLVYTLGFAYFSYSPADPALATLVRFQFKADVDPGRFARERTVTTEVRLRNATAL